MLISAFQVQSSAPACAVIGRSKSLKGRNAATDGNYKIVQFLFFFFLTPSNAGSWPEAGFCCWLLLSYATTVLIACVKISSTPVISLLLHSMYFAPIFRATAKPCSCVTGVKPCVFKRSMQVRFVRRSDLRPTRTNGAYGQKWRTSGYHWIIVRNGHIHFAEILPYPWRSPESWGSRWQNKQIKDLSRDTKAVWGGHTPPVLLCPIELTQASFPWLDVLDRWCSSRKPLARISATDSALFRPSWNDKQTHLRKVALAITD